VLLDTTRLDVFAMEPVTCRWVQAHHVQSVCAKMEISL
jgi:hypothetical protein